MRFLAESRTPVVSLDEIQSVSGAVALTFDDGFHNFYEHAFPVLLQYGFPATVFVISGYSGRQNSWPSQPSIGIPCLKLMNWEQLAEISQKGISLGAHTMTHPSLTRITPQQRESELWGSRSEIEKHTGIVVNAFSYPYGDVNEAVWRHTAQHFGIACTTTLDYVTPVSHRLTLPRLDVHYLQKRFWFERLGTAIGHHYVTVRRHFRGLRSSLRG
jgi:peptidoglycan/xylan/chitin deacetylase (PgdA/CDA1 family)